MTNFSRRTLAAASAGAAIAGVTLTVPANADGVADQRAEGEATMSIERYVITSPDGGIPIISFGVVHDNIVYLSGVTPDAAHLGDIKDQTSQILERIDRLLARGGTNKSNLLTAQVWLTDMSLFAQHNEAWNAWVDPKNPPVRACLLSQQLWHPGMLVEIMVTAAK